MSYQISTWTSGFVNESKEQKVTLYSFFSIIVIKRFESMKFQIRRGSVKHRETLYSKDFHYLQYFLLRERHFDCITNTIYFLFKSCVQTVEEVSWRGHAKLVAYLPHPFSSTGANIAQNKGKLTEIKGLKLFLQGIMQYISQHNTRVLCFSLNLMRTGSKDIQQCQV